MYRYKTVKVNGKTKLKHRHIAESLGPLSPEQHVHHVNDDPYDNRPENLEVMSAEAHRKLHADARLVHPRTKVCEVCGAEYTPHPTKRKRARTCSWECRNELISRLETERAARRRAERGT